MKNLLFTFCFSVSFIALSQSQVINEDIEVIEPFKSINLNAKYTVYLKQSNENKIEVRALKEIMDISTFDVENGVLNIDIKREEKDRSIWEQIDDIKIAPKLDIFISMKEVERLTLNGNGKIVTENSISADNLKLEVYGPGHLEADIKGEKVTVHHSGSGLIKLTGYATHTDLHQSGYGKIEAFDFDLKTMDARITGSGNCEVNVSDELTAAVHGEGKLKFKGGTKKVTKKEYGSGKIERSY